MSVPPWPARASDPSSSRHTAKSASSTDLAQLRKSQALASVLSDSLDEAQRSGEALLNAVSQPVDASLAVVTSGCATGAGA